jgi:hypothetical protein
MMKKRWYLLILVAGLLAQTAVVYGDSHIPTDPNERMLSPDFTLFLAHYDGDTPHLGVDADYAAGSSEVTANGGLIVEDGRFGTGSLDTSGVTTRDPDPNVPNTFNTVHYATEGNFPLQSDVLNPNAAGTIEMWIKPNPGTWNSAGNWDYFFSIYWIDPNPTEPIIPGYEVGDIRIYKRGDSAAPTRIYAHQDGYGLGDQWYTNTWYTTCDFGVSPCVDDGEWHHLAWTWDAVANTSYIYIDGTKDPAGGVNKPPVFFGKLMDNFEIGSHQNGFDNFNGLIDELRISNIDRYAGVDSFVPYTDGPWLAPGCGSLQYPAPASDYTLDCMVNLEDFAEVASRWMVDIGLPELVVLSNEWLLDVRP